MNAQGGRSNRNPQFDEPTRNELRQTNTNIETAEKATPAPATQDSTIVNNTQPLNSSINRKGIEANIATEGVSTPDNRIGPNIKSLNPPVTELSQTTPTKASTEVKVTPREPSDDVGGKDNSLDNTQLVTAKGAQQVATSLLEYPRGNIGSLFTKPDRANLIFDKPMRNMFNKKPEENVEVQTTPLMK